MDEIKKIFNRCGEVLFRMVLYHMIDKGRDSFTEENVAEAKRQIRENDAEAKARKTIPIMTVDFQDSIVDYAAELAKQSITDVLRFVKHQLFFEGDDEIQ